MLSVEARVLAATLRVLVNSAGRSGRKIAKDLGVVHSTLSQWTAGQRIPSRQNLVALLAVLGVPVVLQRDVLTLHYNALGSPDPDYVGVAREVIERTSLPARDVADVLDALARCVDVTPDMSATTIDASDLRRVAAECAD